MAAAMQSTPRKVPVPLGLVVLPAMARPSLRRAAQRHRRGSCAETEIALADDRRRRRLRLVGSRAARPGPGGGLPPGPERARPQPRWRLRPRLGAPVGWLAEHRAARGSPCRRPGGGGSALARPLASDQLALGAKRPLARRVAAVRSVRPRAHSSFRLAPARTTAGGRRRSRATSRKTCPTPAMPRSRTSDRSGRWPHAQRTSG